MGLISNGTTVFDNGSMASGFGGNMVFIKKLTASGSGTLTIYNPSSTTFVKHFISRCHNNHYADRTGDIYVAGYFNTTSAIDAIKFQFNNGNIDDGTIKMYGVK